jgi:hypothetical protein
VGCALAMTGNSKRNKNRLFMLMGNINIEYPFKNREHKFSILLQKKRIYSIDLKRLPLYLDCLKCQSR